MKSLYLKELSIFFTSIIGPLIIGTFLLINSILLWTEISEVNLIENPYASMDTFFTISPIILLIFIPALGMRTFSEEYNYGTIENLITKPITVLQITFVKFLSILTLVSISILPTLIYVYTIYILGESENTLDLGGIIGSYLGLLLYSSIISSISIFCSSFNNNQIISFLLSVFISIIMYFGFEILGDLPVIQPFSSIIKKIGIMYHYNMISKGVIILSDMIYFISISLMFIKLTEFIILNKLNR
tara:strand:- start:51 stop:785 length:735 start_codon:yes stop_codon:yes gene_type:complete